MFTLLILAVLTVLAVLSAFQIHALVQIKRMISDTNTILGYIRQEARGDWLSHIIGSIDELTAVIEDAVKDLKPKS